MEDLSGKKIFVPQEQIQFDGTSLAYTFTGATAPSRNRVQFFDNNGSRASGSPRHGRPGVASRARELGVRSVPAVAVNGRLAECCAGRGPDEASLCAAGVGRPL